MRNLTIKCLDKTSSVVITDPTGNPRSPAYTIRHGQERELQLPEAYFEAIEGRLINWKEEGTIEYTVSGGSAPAVAAAQPEEVDMYKAAYNSKEAKAWENYGGVPKTFGAALDRLAGLLAEAEAARDAISAKLEATAKAAAAKSTKKAKPASTSAPKAEKSEKPDTDGGEPKE